MTAITSVSVFCGSSSGGAESYRRSAWDLGRGLAANGIRIVYGGGGAGMMGAVADAALAAGGEVIGVIPTFLAEREHGHKGLSEMHVVANMHDRKRLMFELSQATCALPGGLGTLDEVIELATWRQLGLHARATVVVSTDGYWDRLQALVEAVIQEGFAHPAARSLLTFVPSAEAAVQALMRLTRETAEPDPRRL